MRNFDKNKFDEIFREGLTAPAMNEVDEDWVLMKTRLQDSQSRSKFRYYMIIGSSIAAVFLVIFSLVFNSDESVPDQENLIVKSKPESKIRSQDLNPERNTNVISSTPLGSNISEFNSVELVPENIYSGNSTQPLKSEAINPEVDRPDLISNNTMSISDSSSAAGVTGISVQPTINTTTLLLGNITEKEKPLSSIDSEFIEKDERDNLKSISSKSRFSLAINFAPDLNGVEKFQSNQVSYSIGAGLIYDISKKFSVEAGAAYGKKSYQTGFSSFKPAGDNLFQVKPNIVSSGFDVMDIQLNMAYTLLNKGKSSVGLGAGISSYLMLNEQYSFTYNNMNARGISSFRTGYQNNHFLGIANLNLIYKTSLTNNVKLAINPYLKLPLTDLGYGNIRLRSAGISLGVITNLSKSKK